MVVDIGVEAVGVVVCALPQDTISIIVLNNMAINNGKNDLAIFTTLPRCFKKWLHRYS